MPYRTVAWTTAQLHRMNSETFMVDFLDTFKISPLTRDTDETISHLTEALERIESLIKQS